MNQVILIGNVLDCPEAGKAGRYSMSEFSIFVPKERSKNLADVIHVTTFRDKAVGVENHIKEGDRVMVIGKVASNEYQDKSGKVRYSTQVIAKTVMKITALNTVEQFVNNIGE